MSEKKEVTSLEMPKAETTDQLRDLKGNWLSALNWICRIWVIYQVVVALGFLTPTTMSHRAIHLIFALVIIFLLYPFSKKHDSMVKFPDFILMGLGVGSAGYVFYIQQFMPELAAYRAGITYDYEIVLGVIAILIILEATRRVLGLILPLITATFLLYGYFSQYLPGIFYARGYGFERIVNHVYISANGIWGIILGISAREIFMFVLFATFFLFSGVGDVIMKVAMGWFGGRRGGPAKAATVASGFFGMLSGAAVANIMTTGAFTIPLMKRVGYPAKFAGAVEACASTGGMFTPPFMGAAAFIMAQFLGVPYGQIVLVTILPAILFYIAVFFGIDAQSRIQGLKGYPKEELPNAWEAIKKGWYFFIPLALLIYLLVVLFYPPQRAALYGIGAMLVVYLYHNLGSIEFKKILDPIEKGAKAAVTVAIVTACIGILVGMIELTGLGVRLSSGLLALAGDSLPLLLLLTMLASFILGMGLVPSAAYITLAILVAPALIEFGIEPLAAHYFVFVFGMMAMITPPVAVASYVAATVAGSNMIATGLQGFKIAIPFFIVPFMIAYEPRLMGLGEPFEVFLAVITAIVGIWAFSCGVFGSIIRKAVIWERVLLLPGAVLLIHPLLNYNIYGILLVGLSILLHYFRLKYAGIKFSDI